MTPAQYNEYQRQADVIEEEKKRLSELSKQEISDEEIWEASINYDNGATYETPIVHFQQGAIWYREQLKQK